MAGVFKPGQLVKLDPMLVSDDSVLPLYNVPGGVVRSFGENVHVIGQLKATDVALVVARERTKAGEVYVLGPSGGGWAPAAFLKIVEEPKVDNASSSG